VITRRNRLFNTPHPRLAAGAHPCLQTRIKWPHPHHAQLHVRIAATHCCHTLRQGQTCAAQYHSRSQRCLTPSTDGIFAHSTQASATDVAPHITRPCTSPVTSQLHSKASTLPPPQLLKPRPRQTMKAEDGNPRAPCNDMQSHPEHATRS
jgi:hypothetical protein